MLRESGTIVEIDADALWVETLQKTVCNSCQAQKGCGQHALAKVLSNASVIRVLLHDRLPSTFNLNQKVAIGIPEDVVVKGSLLVYLLPLVLMVLFSILGFSLIPVDGFAALLGIAGLFSGGLLVRWHSHLTRDDPRQQPVLLDP